MVSRSNTQQICRHSSVVSYQWIYEVKVKL